jgi:hypothetical protein
MNKRVYLKTVMYLIGFTLFEFIICGYPADDGLRWLMSLSRASRISILNVALAQELQEHVYYDEQGHRLSRPIPDVNKLPMMSESEVRDRLESEQECFDLFPIRVEKGSSWAGVRLAESTKPLSLLSYQEQRNLLQPYVLLFAMDTFEPFTPFVCRDSPQQFIGKMASAGASLIDSPIDLVSISLRPHDSDKILLMEAFSMKTSRAELSKWISKKYRFGLTNFMADGLIELWHPEFSPGNGVLREITSDKERALLLSLAKEEAKAYSSRHPLNYLTERPENVAFFVLKLYGKKEVIWQEVYWAPRLDRGFTKLLPTEIRELRPSIISRLEQQTLTQEEEKRRVDNTAGFSDVHFLEALQYGYVPDLKLFWRDFRFPLLDAVVPYYDLQISELCEIRSNNISMAQQFALLCNEAGMNSIRDYKELADLILSSYEMPYGTGKKNLGATSDWETEYHFSEWLSPVTHKTLEPWHKEWSRGNGYIRKIEDPAALPILRRIYHKKLGPDPDERYLYGEQIISNPDAFSFYYVRLYGDKPGSIIAEGVWCAIDHDVV